MKKYSGLNSGKSLNLMYVDRFTGWWHVLGNAGDLNLAFDAAEDLWKCFLDQIKSFVEGLEGVVSEDYDCTNVRPDFESLKELIELGCSGDPASFDKFPCHLTEDCQ